MDSSAACVRALRASSFWWNHERGFRSAQYAVSVGELTMME
jgi:hypothetical protein